MISRWRSESDCDKDLEDGSGGNKGIGTGGGLGCLVQGLFVEAVFECGFRAKPITDSGASRSLIPIQADHRFRTNPISDSGPKPITFRR